MKKIIVVLLSVITIISLSVGLTSTAYAAAPSAVVTASTTVTKNSWKKENGKWYYYRSGQKVKYLNKINGKYYYFNGSGVMLTGWIQFKDGKRYFNGDGSMAVGWKTISNRKYYFKSNGYMAVYTNTIAGKTYYFNGAGVMQTGWLKFNNGKWRYYMSNGVMVTGWKNLNAKKYYFDNQGYMAVYTKTINGNTYYFNGSGVMQTGWLRFKDGKWRFFDENGVRANGWQTTQSGEKRCFNNDGTERLFNGNDAESTELALILRDSLVENENVEFDIEFASHKSMEEAQRFQEDIHQKAVSEELANSPFAGDFIAFDGIDGVQAYCSGCGINDTLTSYTFGFGKNHPYTDAQYKAFQAKVKSVIDESGIRNLTRYEKVRYIYDYICDNVEYDHNYIVHSDNPSFSAYGALMKHKAVCQGYSVLFYCLCKEAGVPVRVIEGDVDFSDESHAWNIVQMEDGLWYNVDATWGVSGSNSWFLRGNNTEDFPSHHRYSDYLTDTFMQKHPMSKTAYSAN